MGHVVRVIRGVYGFERLVGTSVVSVIAIFAGFFTAFGFVFANHLVAMAALLLSGPGICEFRFLFIITFDNLSKLMSSRYSLIVL